MPMGIGPGLSVTRGGSVTGIGAIGADLALWFDENQAYKSSGGGIVTPDSILTYTAPSPKMVYGSDGVLGYAGHNLALYSGTLTDASWTKTNGSYSGGKLTENGSTGLHAVSRNVTVTAGRLIVSVRLKAAERSAGRIFIGSTNGFQVNFNLSVPSVSGGSNVGTGVYESAGVIDLGGGEYRVWLAGRAADASSVFYVYMNNGVSVSYTGDGASGMFINEVQVEFSGKSLPGTYIPTTTAAVYSLPRDYNPTTLAALGVLVEEARTNLITYSQEADNAAWTKDRLTTSANAVAAPDGTMTGDTLVETATILSHETYRSVTVTANTDYCWSRYVKAAGRTKGRISWATPGFGSGVSVEFDLTAGTVASAVTYGTGTVAGSGIQALPDGWFRVWLAGKLDDSSTSGLAALSLSDGSSFSYTGDITKGLSTWGAQLE